MMVEVEVWDGRQVAAARALAGLIVVELAAAAGTTKRIITEIETRGEVLVSPKRRHGCVSRDLWSRITAALLERGVELIAEADGLGSGARWVRPRDSRVGDKSKRQ